MSSILFTIAGFITCVAFILLGGSKLSKYGDIIADLTGIGKAWLGLVLMGAITSLPELITGISSILIIDAPEIAVGDVMGSCAFNLLILAFLDYFIPGKPLSSVVTKGHVVGGFLGMILLTFSVIAILFASVFPVIGWISSSSILLIAVYFISVRIIFKNETRLAAEAKQGQIFIKKNDEEISLPIAIRRYVIAALIVVLAAIFLPYFAEHLSDQTGMNKSFVGTLLVAATTSLPELAVSVSAVRRGSVDIAVGNLLGSNIFNMLILSIDDIIYTKGALLASVSINHALSGLVALLMTAIVGISIVYSTPFKRFSLGIDAIILVVFYVLLMVALYHL
jgi:cation:H+ antiporter